MVAPRGQLFFNTQIPACLWFLAKQKTARPSEVLFIDARKLGSNVSRVQIELLDSDIERIAQTVANWRGGCRWMSVEQLANTLTWPASAAAYLWPKSPSTLMC